MLKACKIDGVCRAPLPKAMKRSFVEKRSIVTATYLVFCLTLSGLAQQNPTPPANPAPQNEPQQGAPGQPKPAVPATPSAGAPVDSNSYKVGPSDILLIRVWNEPEFSGPVAVQQNGNLTLPLVGDLPVGGKTPIEIQAIIAKALTKYVVKPLVTVTVQEVGSKKYYMDGMIAHPGEYALVTPISVLEAISKAGGTQDFANVKRIYILRGDKRIYFNLKDVLHGKHMEQNIPVEPGDHIVVP
jgi:polysaccharide biosynthesis/export protein